MLGELGDKMNTDETYYYNQLYLKARDSYFKHGDYYKVIKNDGHRNCLINKSLDLFISWCIDDIKKGLLKMTYNMLKRFFTKFHIGKIKKSELICAIGLWQETLYGGRNEREPGN